MTDDGIAIEALRLVEQAGFEAALVGGWSRELLGVEPSRPHADVDLLVTDADVTALDRWLAEQDEIVAKRFAHKRAFRLAGTMVQLHLVARLRNGVQLVVPTAERFVLDPVCISCTRPVDDPNTIAISQHWKIVIHPDQTVPCALLLVSRRHVPKLSGLHHDEATEMTDLFPRIETALETGLGATMVNFSCLRNWAFRSTDPIPPFLDGIPNPHVHWHVAPRYDHPVTIGRETFHDGDFGKELRWTARAATTETIAAIRTSLLRALGVE